MKTALCYFGFFRSFKDVYQTHIDNIINTLNNVDVFIYCPNIYYPNINVDEINIRNTDDNNSIDLNFVKKIFGKNIKSSVFYEYNKDIFINKVNEEQINPQMFPMNFPTWRIYSMFYSIQNVISLKKKFENKTNSKYDRVILMRPDLLINSPISLINLDLNKVSFSPNHLGPIYNFDKSINDHLLVTNSINSNILLNLYNNMAGNIKNNNIVINNETLLGYEFIKNNIEFDIRDIVSHTLVR